MIDQHEELPVRAQTIKLPGTKELALDRLKDILDLSSLQEVVITPRDITVTRQVAENQPVIPFRNVEATVDGETVLHRVSDDVDDHPFDPEEHPFTATLAVMQRITQRGLRPNWILGPQDGWVEAYFGLPEEPPASHVFGMRIIRFKDRDYRKLVVVGGPTDYLSDASYGVIMDMGV